MKVGNDFNIRDIHFWGDALDVVLPLMAQDRLNELEIWINQMFLPNEVISEIKLNEYIIEHKDLIKRRLLEVD